MTRDTPFLFAIALALGVLLAIVGFRFSFVSADVSTLAKELGQAKVRIVELEAALRESKSEQSGTAARPGEIDLDQLPAEGTPRSEVLKLFGGPTRGFSLERGGNSKYNESHWVDDAGKDAGRFVRGHLPVQFSATGAWQFGSVLIFFNSSDKVEFACQCQLPPRK